MSNWSNWLRYPEDLSIVPASEGVYLLSESSFEIGIIYVGRADDLGNRLPQHQSPDNPCLQRKTIQNFAYLVTNDSEQKEQELINRYNPECNRQ